MVEERRENEMGELVEGGHSKARFGLFGSEGLGVDYMRCVACRLLGSTGTNLFNNRPIFNLTVHCSLNRCTIY